MFETARYTAYLQIAAQMPKGKSLKLSDLGQFPWEIEEKAVLFSPEEFAARLKNFEAAEERDKAANQGTFANQNQEH